MGIRLILGRHSLNPPGWCRSPHLGTSGGDGRYGQAQTTRQHNCDLKCDWSPSGTEISHKGSLSDALSQQIFWTERRSDHADRRMREGRSGLEGVIGWVLYFQQHDLHLICAGIILGQPARRRSVFIFVYSTLFYTSLTT